MKDLKYWLRKTPQPAAILADDKKIDVPKNGRAWKDLSATIRALEPSKLTCLTKDGDVIRSIVLEEDEDKDKPDRDLTPEQSDLQLFATLLERAYDKGSSKTQPILDSAMMIVERLSSQVTRAEAEVTRLRNVVHKQTLQIAELSGAPQPPQEESLLGAVIAGMAQGAAGAATLTAVPPPKPAAQGSKK